MRIDQVRPRLKALGQTQGDLAHHLGVSHNHLSQLLSGKRRMSLETMQKIEAFLANRSSGVEEAKAPFHEAPLLRCITLEEARALRDKAPVRLSHEERERFFREMAELAEAGRRLPRVSGLSDDELLGYDDDA